MEQGFISDVISTDLHTGNINGPVYDLPTTLSKFLHLGLSLEEVLEKSTIAAAKTIRREAELGHLKIETVADVAVFDCISGEFEFRDTPRYGVRRRPETATLLNDSRRRVVAYGADG